MVEFIQRILLVTTDRYILKYESIIHSNGKRFHAASKHSSEFRDPTSLIASAISRSSSTIKPVRPCSIISGSAPYRNAITGVPQANSSIATRSSDIRITFHKAGVQTSMSRSYSFLCTRAHINNLARTISRVRNFGITSSTRVTQRQVIKRLFIHRIQV
jgi:hypothetical protein